jgi:hypothetical protein
MVASWSSHFASMVVELPWWRVVPSLTDPAMAVGSRILPARRSGRERRSSGSGREREHAVAGVGVGCGVTREEVSGCGSGG